MSHALLLRLFLSPSFFSVHVALQYLRIYADNIGITYYLTRRLRELDTRELREVWGFVCHLLVTRPSKSRALECFVVEIAQKSTHIAMLTLWFMQAHLKDIPRPDHTSESFLICQRVLNQCHEMIYGDLPASGTPYSIMNILSLPGIIRKKIKPNVNPALVGIGIVLAGVPGMPSLTTIMGEVAIEQGRFDDQGNDLRSLDNPEGIVRTLSESDRNKSQYDDGEDDLSDPEPAAEPTKGNSTQYEPSRSSTSPLNDGSQVKSGGRSRRQTVGAQTSPALPLHIKNLRKPRLSEDPFGQNDADQSDPSSLPSPFQSTPTFSASRHFRRPNSLTSAEVLLQKYDLSAQKYLLRSHYCRSEIQFLLALENICNRLLVVPKPARVSALRAELTALNHKLPAEVCMPMWCSSSDTLDPETGLTEPHHKIVRIPPGESVVLNSAERAPYLLLIEILHAELDFDPIKRPNKEILKKIVAKENERKGASGDLIGFPGPNSSEMERRKSQSGPDPDGPGGILDVDTRNIGSNDHEAGISTMSLEDSLVSPTDEEEVDLVEQLYGIEGSLHSHPIDLSDSIVLPPAPKNRELDMVTWSSTPPSPQTSMDASATLAPRPSLSRANSHRAETPRPQVQRVLSLDEYSERMRTAAVMLAQLNANQIKESAASLTVPGTPSLMSASPGRWLPGSSWLTITPPAPETTAPAADSAQVPQTPALGSAPMRMRLPAAEAAAIRTRIMDEMLALEEERMERMRENRTGEGTLKIGDTGGNMKTAEDEGIIRRELSKADPSAVVVGESWATKKSRIRQASPYGHLANWDCVSVIVKTGGDLRQEQLAVQLIQEFEKIFKDENCLCWLRYFRILITGNNSGLVETITDAVSIHSIKKAEYARRLATGRLGHVSLYDHFKTAFGDPTSAKFVRAQRNFAKSLAGYSVVTYLLQIKDRHNGNILIDRDGHLIHIDFGFMLSNSPGNIGFEAAPFKLPLEYIEVLGGIDSEPYKEFRRLFKEGFDAARKHCDRIITLVELMQKDSTLPCFAALGEQTASQLRDRFQQGLTQSAVEEHVERLIDTSLGSNWTRLYDSYQYYSQSIL
ncbi:kinase-like protein [Trametopsis cervina]|nr:kinase-like protein [Trametopsis cervina]